VRENAALLALADEMAQRPDNVLNLLCELILQTCGADSAGVSLLREETDEFVWPAVAGAWAPFVNGSMPRSASPCGKVIEYDEVLIFRDVIAQFPATGQATPDIEEIMLAPFHRDGAPIGTVWAISHDPLREFDAEDRRVLTSLARFAAAAYQTFSAHQSARQSRERLKSAVELAGLGLYSIEIDDGESRLTWDDRVRTMWGLPESTKVPLQVWLDGIHAEDRDRIEAAAERAYDPAGDGLYDVEYRVLGADGVERWVATHGKTRFEGGKPVSFLGAALDITEQKVVERGLALVIEMRDSDLHEVTATLEAEATARERVSERLELLQSELSRGLFAALERRQKGPFSETQERVVEAARKIADLSPREREVLDGLVAGEPHKIIAYRLDISVRTVELHRTRMLHRLGTPHLADAIRLAVLAELAAE
jgi:PAS domain S-box-containing protein